MTTDAAGVAPLERHVRPRALLLTHRDGRETLHPMSEYATAYRDTATGQLLLYDVATVRWMIEGAWCAGYYDAGYTHDSAYAEKASEKCSAAILNYCVDDGMPLDGSNPNPPDCDPRA